MTVEFEPCPGCGFVRVVGRDCACCAIDARRSPHRFEKQETVLTPRADGSYVQAGRTTCETCGESFWWVMNVVTPGTTLERLMAASQNMAVEFGRIAGHSACRGKANANA